MISPTAADLRSARQGATSIVRTEKAFGCPALSMVYLTVSMACVSFFKLRLCFGVS